MPQKVLKFSGINRKINEYQSSGACEELINLRPDINGGHQVVKPKHIVGNNVTYSVFYEHSFGDISNSITVAGGIVKWINPEGILEDITVEFAGKEVFLSSAGNVLVIYCKDEDRQLVFRFKDHEYESYDFVPPHISYALMDYYDLTTPEYTATVEGDTLEDYKMALNAAASGFYSQHPKSLCGASVVGCTFEMEDGSEIWSTAFTVANPLQYKDIRPTDRTEDGIKKVVVYGVGSVYFCVTLSNAQSFAGVSKINVYASKPVYQYDITDLSNVTSTIMTKKLSLAELDLDSQLMYYQGSIDVTKYGQQRIQLNFGQDQTGEKLMDVTSGCIERTGMSFSYNNRFHYYQSKANHIIQTPTTSTTLQTREGESTWIAYVKFEDGWKLINGTHSFFENKPQDFIYPLNKIKRLAFVKGQWSDQMSFSVPYEEMFYVDLKDSTAYNYSYAFEVTPNIVSAADFRAEMEEAGQLWSDGFVYDTKVLMKDEVNTINVSAAYNPFDFPVEYSYGFGGKILEISTSYIPISSTQAGQYPLTIFTSGGIFALEQGDGSVLYSNIVPLQPLVSDGNAIATPYGTFFISSKNLYVLSGREVANVSYVLSGERELSLRNSEAFNKLCMSKSKFLHNFTNELSNEDFEEYISDARLSYDPLNNEVFICSNSENIQYSYVFNIDTKAYHKVAKKYIPSQSNGRYVIEIIGDKKNLVDMLIEERGSQPILLQSRPMALEAFFTHIQRMILLADAKLTGSQNLCISVFGSDNLYDWKCIISSQKYDTVFRQIRTNKAAKSYRDYIILINGVVDTNTDISDLIADYTVVTRRLG